MSSIRNDLSVAKRYSDEACAAAESYGVQECDARDDSKRSAAGIIMLFIKQRIVIIVSSHE
jgi:hypothetical protein